MFSSWGVVQRWANPLLTFNSPSHFGPILHYARLLLLMAIMGTRKSSVLTPGYMTTYWLMSESLRYCGSLGRKLLQCVEVKCRYLQIKRSSLQYLYRFYKQKSVLKLGYSSLAVALILPEGGQLVACERDAKSLEVAQRYYDRAGVSNKVNVKLGLAVDTLKKMIENGESGSYDFAFVDAEKKMYQDYFELLLQLVRVGGVIAIDNVLWHGRVSDPVVNDPKTISIRSFNSRLMEDERVSISMVPIGDGMTICCKR